MNSSQLFLIPRRSGYPQLLILLGVACTYCLAAALGFQLAVVAKQVTAVWPPTGIALAAILIYGYRVWPAITVSAFLVNYLTGEPWQTALTIGIGNTLEAVVGAYLLKRLGFHNALERLKDVLALIALAAMFSTTISATVGVISLCGAGIASWSSFGSVWLVWWVGDALGNLIVAPLLLTWSEMPSVYQEEWRSREAGIFCVVLIGVCITFLSSQLIVASPPYQHKYVIFPFLFWAALRYGPRLTITAVFSVAVIVLWGVTHDLGPFMYGTESGRLFLPQAYLATIAMTALAMGALNAERRQISQRLLLSEGRSRRMMNSNMMGISFGNVNGEIVDSNSAFLMLVGRTQVELQAGQISWKILSPQEESILDERIQEQLRTAGVCKPVEKELCCPGGRRLTVMFGAAMMEGSDECACFVLDITERRRSESRVAAQHATTQILVESRTLEEAAQRILRVICESLNCTFGILWKIDVYSSCLRSVDAWHQSEASAGQLRALAARQGEQKGHGLAGRVWQRGQSLWIDPKDSDTAASIARADAEAGGTFASPILNGLEVLGVMEFSAPDLTIPDEELLQMLANIGSQIGQFMDRRRVEEALRDSEERYRTVAETAWDAIILIDARGKILLINRAAERIFGYAVEEMVGMFLSQLIPECLNLVQQLSSRSSEGLEDTARWESLEVSGLHWNGKQVPLELSLGEVSIRGERVFTGIARDITERQKVEEERAQLLSREREARREAELANQAKDEFLATVSHELRTPLNAILGWSGLLGSGDLDADTSARAIETISRNARAQAQVVDDLLDVSRVIGGRMTLSARQTDVRRVIEAAVESVQLAADSKGIRLRLDLGAEPAQISADAGRLQQVFWNLLSNAVKFTPRGGQVDLRVERSEPHLAVIISDTGKGILPEFLPFVFDRFRQADSSTTRRFGGLGLGLSIVRHIVELHGGSVEAASRGDGQGSTFTVRLPLKHGADTDSRRLQTATALAEPASASSAAGILEGVRVLAVDDELDSLDFVVSALRVNGAEVQSATCVEDALNVLKSWDATLLISDLAMPEENGYALIEKVRAQDSLNRLPAIALSAYAQESDRQQALAAGYTYYIAKPIGPSELVDAVAEIAKGDKKITAGV